MNECHMNIAKVADGLTEPLAILNTLQALSAEIGYNQTVQLNADYLSTVLGMVIHKIEYAQEQLMTVK